MMGLFKRKHKSTPITCDETDYLVWKWHPQHKSKNSSVTVGTKIKVNEGAAAVFVYKNDLGTYLDFLTGPQDESLSAENLPIIANIMGESFTDQAPLKVEVYFINLAKTMQAGFTVPEFEVHDSAAPDIGVPVTVKSTLTYRIVDAAEFVKRHRLDEVSEASLMKQVTDAATQYMQSAMINAPTVDNLPVVEFERRISEINDLVEIPIRERLADDLGVKVTSMDIETIDIDEKSAGYQKLTGQRPDSDSAASDSSHPSPSPANEPPVSTPTPAPTSTSTPTSTQASTPTPPPSPSFYVAINQKPVGPYQKDTLQKMLAENTITKETLAWRSGMTEWTKISSIEELQDLV